MIETGCVPDFCCNEFAKLQFPFDIRFQSEYFLFLICTAPFAAKYMQHITSIIYFTEHILRRTFLKSNRGLHLKKKYPNFKNLWGVLVCLLGDWESHLWHFLPLLVTAMFPLYALPLVSLIQFGPEVSFNVTYKNN